MLSYAANAAIGENDVEKIIYFALIFLDIGFDRVYTELGNEHKPESK